MKNNKNIKEYEIYYNNELLTEKYNIQRSLFFITDKKNVYKKTEIDKKTYFYCNSCHEKIIMKSGLSYYLNKNKISKICNGCNNTGENNPFYGKSHTEETKKLIGSKNKEKYKGENNPFYGKSHTEETKKIISSKNKGKFIGENNPFYGKSHTEETKKILRKKTTNYFKNLSEEEYYEICKKMSDGQIKLYNENPEEYIKMKRKAAFASAISQNNRYEMNNLEKKVYNELIRRNIIDHFKFSVILGSYQYDFGNKEHRILIEVQGDYWHGNSNLFSLDEEENKRLLNETQLKVIEKDSYKKDFALKHNYDIYYIWEEDINNNNFDILDIIEKKFFNRKLQ